MTVWHSWIKFYGFFPILSSVLCSSPSLIVLRNLTQTHKFHFLKFRYKSNERSDFLKKDCAGVILYLAEKATQVALEAIQILGGNQVFFIF